MQKTILVVEDDQMSQFIYQSKLTKSGYKVFLARHGGIAIDFLAVTIPSLIILDLMVPTMDGFDFLQALNNNPIYQSIPKLIVSNLNQPQLIEQSLLLGATDFLVKSNTSLQQLLLKIQQLMSLV